MAVIKLRLGIHNTRPQGQVEKFSENTYFGKSRKTKFEKVCIPHLKWVLQIQNKLQGRHDSVHNRRDENSRNGLGTRFTNDFAHNSNFNGNFHRIWIVFEKQLVKRGPGQFCTNDTENLRGHESVQGFAHIDMSIGEASRNAFYSDILVNLPHAVVFLDQWFQFFLVACLPMWFYPTSNNLISSSNNATDLPIRLINETEKIKSL